MSKGIVKRIDIGLCDLIVRYQENKNIDTFSNASGELAKDIKRIDNLFGSESRSFLKTFLDGDL